MMKPVVSTACPKDAPAWLDLAREVESLFGPMVDDPGFQAALNGAISGGTALSARLGDETIGGVVVDPENGWVAWLVVAERARGRGAGAALVAAALTFLGEDRDVRVQTFAPDVAAGAPARALYERFGFVDEATADPTPAGVATVVMLRRKSQRAGTNGSPA